jgi:adenylyl cyclase-associated protein
MRGGSEFYSNRILKEFKDKDQTQVDWVKGYNGFLRELQTYIKDYHTTGLTWNAQGGEAKALATSAGSAAPKAAGGLPPPPPPPSAPLAGPPTTTGAKPAVDTAGLFSEISKGTAVTSGLKKVTDDQKTKNRKPEERSSLVPAESAKKSSTSSSAKADKSAPSRPPRFALDGNKWVVEFQQGAQLEITETEPKQTVYIYRSENTTVQIKGKVNTIILDACKKVGVVFENAISGVEVVNSTSVEVQVLGKVPNIAIDKTAGVQLYLGKDTLASEIVSSNSSVMNVLIPGEHEGDDLIELAIPEQYKTIIKGGKLITESVHHV